MQPFTDSLPTRKSPISIPVQQARRRTSRLIGILLALVFLYGLVYSRTVSYELRLNQRQKDLKQLKEENTLLRARVVQAQSAAHIDQQVSQVLQMQLPQQIEYVQVPHYVVDGDLQTAASPPPPSWHPAEGF